MKSCNKCNKWRLDSAICECEKYLVWEKELSYWKVSMHGSSFTEIAESFVEQIDESESCRDEVEVTVRRVRDNLVKNLTVCSLTVIAYNAVELIDDGS